MKNIRVFYLKIFIFLVVKFSICLNSHVFVMKSTQTKREKANTSNEKISDKKNFFLFALVVRQLIINMT